MVLNEAEGGQLKKVFICFLVIFTLIYFTYQIGGDDVKNADEASQIVLNHPTVSSWFWQSNSTKKK